MILILICAGPEDVNKSISSAIRIWTYPFHTSTVNVNFNGGKSDEKKRAVTLAFIAPRGPSHQSNPLCFIPAKMLCQLLPSFKISIAPLITYPPPFKQRRNSFNVAPSWIMIPTFRYGPVGRLFLDSSIHIKWELLVLHLKYARSMEGLNSAQDIWGA